MFFKRFLAVTAALISVIFALGTSAYNSCAAAYDEIRRGEGYYYCCINYRDGIPKIYSEDGEEAILTGAVDGYLKEGETLDDAEKAAAEKARKDLVAVGADPDDYVFDIYTYFYDDYDYTTEEFYKLIYREELQREIAAVHSANVKKEAPNPAMGNGFPYVSCGAAFCAAAVLLSVRAANSKHSADK